MKTKAIRLYGANKIQLDEFELPQIKDDEIMVEVISDSICMSTYKAVSLGANHLRVPNDCDVNPIILGHEFSGNILEVGKKWQHQFKPGEKFAIQPALNYKGSMDSPGYSFRYCGGDMTIAIIPHQVMELGCLIKYEGEAYFEASLSEPMSCVIGAFHATYHTIPNSYEHVMDIKKDSKMAILGGCGPMGLGAIDYALHRDRKPKTLVVTDLSDERLQRASEVLTVEDAKANGVELIYVNPSKAEDQIAYLKSFVDGGYDDVFVFAPVKPLVEQGDQLLGKDGTLNFFSGPTDKTLSANINMYNVHYQSTKLLGSTGGNADDMKDSLKLSAQKRTNPGVMITHVGGLDSVCDTVLNLPKIPGGKKLIYTHLELPLTPITDFYKLANKNPKFNELHEICKKHKFIWTAEAEKFLLNNFVS
jgi:threonine dehydrogenase-like Zn-dependent dehydrogenase